MNTKPHDICERSFEFAKQIIALCQLMDAKPGVSRTLSHQVLRSGTSIGANIEEAQTLKSRGFYCEKLYSA